MTREEMIERLKKISEYAVHRSGEPLRIMSLDDGIALCEAAEMLEKESSIIDQVLEIIGEKIDFQKERYAEDLDAPNYLEADWRLHAIDGMEIISEAMKALKGEQG